MADDGENLESIFEVMDELLKIVEFVVGYRAKLQEQGFSETAAEQMCVDLHRNIMQHMGASAGG